MEGRFPDRVVFSRPIILGAQGGERVGFVGTAGQDRAAILTFFFVGHPHTALRNKETKLFHIYSNLVLSFFAPCLLALLTVVPISHGASFKVSFLAAPPFFDETNPSLSLMLPPHISPPQFSLRNTRLNILKLQVGCGWTQFPITADSPIQSLLSMMRREEEGPEEAVSPAYENFFVCNYGVGGNVLGQPVFDCEAEREDQVPEGKKDMPATFR